MVKMVSFMLYIFCHSKNIILSRKLFPTQGTKQPYTYEYVINRRKNALITTETNFKIKP